MKEWINKTHILIVGLGLIGGSYAKALKRFGYRISAIDTSAESIAYAEENGIIDKGYTEPSEAAISDADVIVLSLYPKTAAEWIKDNLRYIKKDTLITDTTGVKSCVVYKIQELLSDTGVEFIAAHPMAGREVSGVQNSDDAIFRNANFIVTPTEKNTPEATEWCKSLGKILGFKRISELSPEKHDEVIAFVSQLTHCIAVSLMTAAEDGRLASYTGDSFRDLTRIANINDKMWSELFIANKEALLSQMDAFLSEFGALRDMLEKEDAEGLREKMRLSTKRRKEFDK